MDDDDQVDALRAFVRAMLFYITAEAGDAPVRRAELCESVGRLLWALERPAPVDKSSDRGPVGGNPTRRRPGPPRRGRR